MLLFWLGHNSVSYTLLRVIFVSLFGLGQIAILCALLSVISVPWFGLYFIAYDLCSFFGWGQNSISCTLVRVISVSLFGLRQIAILFALLSVISIPLFDVYFIAYDLCSFFVGGGTRFHVL